MVQDVVGIVRMGMGVWDRNILQDVVLSGTGTWYRMLCCQDGDGCLGPEQGTGCCVVRDRNMLQDVVVLSGTGTCYRMLLCCQGPEHVTG